MFTRFQKKTEDARDMLRILEAASVLHDAMLYVPPPPQTKQTKQTKSTVNA